MPRGVRGRGEPPSRRRLHIPSRKDQKFGTLKILKKSISSQPPEKKKVRIRCRSQSYIIPLSLKLICPTYNQQKPPKPPTLFGKFKNGSTFLFKKDAESGRSGMREKSGHSVRVFSSASKRRRRSFTRELHRELHIQSPGPFCRPKLWEPKPNSAKRSRADGGATPHNRAYRRGRDHLCRDHATDAARDEHCSSGDERDQP